jgi:tripartite-type tricarboxylate transporter receptor subunit TctC
MRELWIAPFAVILGMAVQGAATAQGPADAGHWPLKPIHMIVPFPAGSSPDLIARMLNDKLAAALGQPVIVENRPGAGGNIGTALVAAAAPDGQTIGLSIGGPLAVNKVLYAKLNYDPFVDLAPVTLVASSPNVLVVDPKLGVGSVRELIDLAKAKPGNLNYGSVGNGSASHLTMELLKSLAGVDIVHVPYPGSPQVNSAIAGGQIAAAFVVPGTAMPLVQAGRLKAIAVTSAKRSPVLPQLPTIAEAGFPGFQSTAWLGIVAPAKTPAPVIDRLASELSRIIRSDETEKRMQALYFQAIGSTPVELAAFMREEVERWGKVIKLTGAKVD